MKKSEFELLMESLERSTEEGKGKAEKENALNDVIAVSRCLNMIDRPVWAEALRDAHSVLSKDHDDTIHMMTITNRSKIYSVIGVLDAIAESAEIMGVDSISAAAKRCAKLLLEIVLLN